MAFAPIFLVAFRRGWEGAALAVALTGILVEEVLRVGAVPVERRMGHQPGRSTWVGRVNAAGNLDGHAVPVAIAALDAC